jgi:hypothetical protein
MDNWNYFKIIDKVHKQHTWKSLGTKENGYIGHCGLASKSSNVRVQKFIMGNNIICTIHCDHRTAALFQVYNCKKRV